MTSNNGVLWQILPHIYRFSTRFVSVSARISSWESVRARCCALWLVLEWIKSCISVHRPLWRLGGSPARQRPSGLVRSGVDNLVWGTWRPPSFVGKLLNGKWDQGDRDCVHGRDLIAESNTLRQCFNNMDVGTPSWQSEPRDKSSCREFASSHPSYLSFRISYYNLYAFTFLV